MRSLILILIFTGIGQDSHAQMNSSLTISADDSAKFYLFLDGHIMNIAPERNIRVQHLTERYYSCKIVFEDKMREDISQRYLPMTSGNNLNTSIDAIYHIEGNRKNKKVLNLSSAKPVSITATTAIPTGVAVYDYGFTVPAGPPRTGIAPLPSTIAAANPDNSYASGISVLRDTIQAGLPVIHNTTPILADTIHQPDTPCTHPMSNSDYQAAKAAMNTTTFDETKLKAAKNLAGNNCMLAKQIADLCMIFDFESAKLIFAKYAYHHCFDKEHYARVVNILSRDPDKAVLNMLITRDYPIPVNIMDH